MNHRIMTNEGWADARDPEPFVLNDVDGGEGFEDILFFTHAVRWPERKGDWYAVSESSTGLGIPGSSPGPGTGTGKYMTRGLARAAAIRWLRQTGAGPFRDSIRRILASREVNPNA